MLSPRPSCEISSLGYVDTVDGNGNQRQEALVDYSQQVNLNDAQGVVSAARARHASQPVHGVMGYDDEVMPLVSRIATTLGLVGNPVETAIATRDKALMKERLSAADVPIAPYALAQDEDDAVRWANRSGYPVVVKPVRGAGSLGVIRADSEFELRSAYQWVCRIVHEHGLNTEGDSGTEQLVEQYLDGSEFSVELLARDGELHVLCEFEKPQPLHGPFFEETIYVTPARLTPERRREMQSLAQQAMRALGIRNGPAHCELRLSNEGLFVIEIASRLIGGACSRVFPYVLGENIHEHILNIALGNKQPLPRQQAMAAGAMMIPVPGRGRLVAVNGVESAQEVRGICDVVINVGPGDMILPCPEQSCYIGLLTASANTPEDVIEALTEAAELIDLEISPLTAATLKPQGLLDISASRAPRLGA